MYDKLEGPVLFDLRYSLPFEYQDESFALAYENEVWYMPASGYPQFKLNFYRGYIFNYFLLLNNILKAKFFL